MTNHSQRFIHGQDVICTAINCQADVDPNYYPSMTCKYHAEQVFRIVQATRDHISEVSLNTLMAKVEPVKKTYVVYYIQFPHGIKIGTTSDLFSRLQAFSLPASSVLAVEPGGFELERSRHAFFKDTRIGNTEVFTDSPKIRKHIEAVRKYHGAPKVVSPREAARV